jgi:hypothetical protein
LAAFSSSFVLKENRRVLLRAASLCLPLRSGITILSSSEKYTLKTILIFTMSEISQDPMTRVKIAPIQGLFASTYREERGDTALKFHQRANTEPCFNMLFQPIEIKQVIFCSGHFFLPLSSLPCHKMKQNTSNTNEIVHTYFSNHALPIHAYFDCQTA